MNAGAEFSRKYSNDVLKILESACKSSIQTGAFNEDEEMLSYLSKLRETLVECYTSIVHGAEMSGEKAVLVKYAPNIF